MSLVEAHPLGADARRELDAAARDPLARWTLEHLRHPAAQRALCRALAARSDAWSTLAEDVRASVAAGRAALVRNFPADRAELVVALGATIGTVQEQPGESGPTLAFDVAPAAAPRSISTGRKAFPLHTDSASATRPQRYVALACCRAGTGGTSLLASTDEILGRLGRATVADLRRRAFPLRAPGLTRAKVRRVALVSGPPQAPSLRYREEALRAGIAALRRPLAERWRRALDALEEAVAASEPERLRLAAGDYLLFDNGRLLHGRTAVGDGDRLLKRLKIGGAGMGPP